MVAFPKSNSKLAIASATTLRSASVTITLSVTFGAGTFKGQPDPSTTVPEGVPGHLSNLSIFQ